jgi:hypothetical protein
MGILNQIATWNLAELLNELFLHDIVEHYIVANLLLFVKHCGVKIDIFQPLTVA